jgi:hypothetical protein
MSPTPSVPRRPLSSARRTAVACLASLVALAALAGCRVRYGVEDREALVYVWIDVPAARAADQRVDLTVTVGGRPAAHGTYLFTPARPRQEMPAVYLPAGSHPVVVTLGGAVVASETVPIGHMTWLLVTVDGGGAKIARSRAEPGTYR